MRTAWIVEDQAGAAEWLAKALREAYPETPLRLAGSLAAARGLYQQDGAPELALIDLGLPDGSGIELIDQLGRDAPDCQCIVTTIFADDVHLFPALRAGARGYLLKDQAQADIVRALRGIIAGEPPLSPVIARRLLKVFAPETQANADAGLTPREREVLGLIAKGYKLAEVAQQLGIAHNTAATFVKSVYRKLKVSSRAEATLEAARLGLVRTDF